MTAPDDRWLDHVDDGRVLALLDGLRRPATDAELAGEPAIVAAMARAVGHPSSPVVRTRRTAARTALAAGVVVVGFATAAAATGIVPSLGPGSWGLDPRPTPAEEPTEPTEPAPAEDAPDAADEPHRATTGEAPEPTTTAGPTTTTTTPAPAPATAGPGPPAEPPGHDVADEATDRPAGPPASPSPPSSGQPPASPPGRPAEPPGRSDERPPGPGGGRGRGGVSDHHAAAGALAVPPVINEDIAPGTSGVTAPRQQRARPLPAGGGGSG